MRVDYREVFPEGLKAMLALEGIANESFADARLLDVVKIRASRINGCAYCLTLHVEEARRRGETDRRLDTIAAWRDAECFDSAERAALAWCEALTMLAESGAPDDIFQDLAQHFAARQIVALTLAIIAINGWNRLNVAFRAPAHGRTVHIERLRRVGA